jgi:hypothetical protein
MLLFLLLLSGSISLCIDLSLQREFKKSYLSQYVYKMLHCWIMKYALQMVRAIKSVNGKRVLGMGKNIVRFSVWWDGSGEFQLGKCFESFVNTSIFSGSSHMSKASLVSKPSIISKLNLVCQIIINQITNIFISAAIMLSLTIYLALLCQHIKSNPGPHRHGATTLSIMTYNCNGLGQAPQTRGPRAACGPRGGPMRPSINFKKKKKMTF